MINTKIEEINTCNFMMNILENMQDMVRVIDKDDSIIFMNKAMREKFGNHVGRKCYELVNQTEKCLDCISEKSVQLGEAFKKEVEMTSHAYSVISSPVFNDSTNSMYAVEVFRDITEQKNMEKKIFDQYEKMKTDLDFAKQLQNKIIPENTIYGECIKVISKYEPSEYLGGDIFDIIEIDDDNIGIYIADVSGHGVSASMFTMFLRQAMRNKKNRALSIEETINDLINNYKELKIESETYFTLLYGIYNKHSKEMTFVNAGHNCFPIIIRNGGDIEEINIKGLPICSLVDRFSHQTIKVKMNEQDRILLYTDGIIEAYDEETHTFFGYENLQNVLKENVEEKSEGIIKKIYNQVMDFSSALIKDDIAIVLLDIIK